MKIKHITVLILIFAFILIFYRLGSTPLFEPDEGRYGNVSQEMVLSSDWLVPHKNGFIHFHKPPMTFWVMGVSQKIFGSTEWAVRLPNALFGLLIVLLVMTIARRVGGTNTQILSALIILSVPLFLFMSRLATTDIGLLFWVTLAVYGLLVYRSDNSKGHLLLTYSALGFAMLTKGPIGLLLFFFAAIPYLIIFRGKKRYPFLIHLAGFFIFLGIGLSWYVWAILKYPGLLDYFLFFQTADRVASKTHHYQNFFYFVPVLIALFFPWSVFIPAAVGETVKADEGDLSRKYMLWTFVWAGLIFIFFSVVPSKLASYILPMSVPLSIGFAFYFSKKIFQDNLKDRLFFGSAYFVAFVFVAGGFGMGTYAKFFMHERIIGLQTSFFIFAYLLPLAGLILFWFTQAKKPLLIFFTTIITVYLIGFTLWNGFSRAGTYKTVKPFAEKIIELREGNEPVIAYRKLFSGLPFYLGERVIVICTKTEHKFDSETDKEGYLYGKPEDVDPFIKSKQPCFILTKVSDARELDAQYGDQLEELLRSRKVVLYRTLEGGKRR